LPLRELPAGSAARRDLPRQVQSAGLEIDDLVPLGWRFAGADWWLDPGLGVWVSDDAFALERGQSFANDWIREIWIVAPRGGTRAALADLDALLRGRGATHLRWRVETPLSPEAERYWESCGAEVIGELDDGATLLLQRAAAPPVRAATPSGLALGPVRYGELDTLTGWCAEPAVYRPLGFDEAPDPAALRQALFPADPAERGWYDVTVRAVRRGERLVGVAIENGWDYRGDSIRELNLALPEGGSGPKAILELFAVMMHGCYLRGAAHTLANVRAGPSGAGFARLFGGVGAEDVTAAVRAYGAGQPDRRYWAATRAAFYESKGWARVRETAGGAARG